MAIAHRASGTMVFSAGGTTPVIPAATAAGDIMLMLHAGKFTASPYSPANPAGWTPIGTNSFASGTTVSGVDVGSVAVSCWFREWQSGDTNPTVVAASLGVASNVIISWSKGGGETWDTPVKANASEEGADTSVNATFTTNPGITVGDFLVSHVGFRSDAATPLSTHHTWTATGITPTHTHDLVGLAVDGETTLGNDMGNCVNRTTVTGTSSAAPVLAGTMAAAHWYAAQLVRLRVSVSAAVTTKRLSALGVG